MAKSKSRRGGGAGGRGGRKGSAQTQPKPQSGPPPTKSTNAANASATPTTATATATKPITVAQKMGAVSQDDDTGMCWICAEPVKYYAVPECNHRTCHICALRLRALYKKQDCAFCKVRLPPTYGDETELINVCSFSIGTSAFLDLHNISHRDVHIVQTEGFTL